MLGRGPRGPGAFTSLLACVGVVVLLAAPAFAQAPSNVRYELHLVCPETLKFGPGQAGGRPNSIGGGPLCPVKGIDEDDMMGSPSIAVDMRNPRNIMLASLHGGDGNGPTNRSRNAMPFTTFLSDDGGNSWTDRPFYAPDRIRGAFGEHPQTAFDRFGHVYIGSLYSRRDPDTYSGWNYTLVLQKFRDFEAAKSGQTTRGDANAYYHFPIYPGNQIEQFWFVYDNRTNDLAVVWNEKVMKIEDPELVDPFDPPRSVVAMMTTEFNPKAPWYELTPKKDLIGPCLAATNPVMAAGQVYLGCGAKPEESLHPWADKNRTVRAGQIDLYRVRLTTGNVTYLGPAPFVGGYPQLGVRDDGRLVVLAAGVGPDGNPRMVGAYGKVGLERPTVGWSAPRSYGDKTVKPDPSRKLLDFRVQDLLYRESSGTIHIITKERYESLGLSLDNPASALESQYRKHLITIHEQYGVMAVVDLDVGNLQNRTAFTVLKRQTTLLEPEKQDDVFDDLSDDLVQLLPGNFSYKGEELGPDYRREFIAIGDFGIVMFAEVIEITSLKKPGSPPGPGAPPALSAPALSLSPMTIITGSVGFTLAALLALRLVLARKSDLSTAITKMK